jgi:hypothetical protein
MTDALSAAKQRLLDLLADRAVFGLEPAEEEELEALLAAHPTRDADALDPWAPAVAVAAATATAVSLPATLKTRLGEEAIGFAQRRSDRVIEPAGRQGGWAASGRSSGPRMMVAGLLCALATIACVVLAGRRDPAGGAALHGRERAAGTVMPAPNGQAEAAVPRLTKAPPTAAMLRDEMLSVTGDALLLDCAAAAGDDGKTRGDVVWSGSRQRGFLRISGLSPNEPAESQYQIWIVEGGRGRPVPGGVFDVGREAGEVIVPILPRVFVQGPTTFVVTVEKPGGAEDYSEERSRVLARAR